MKKLIKISTLLCLAVVLIISCKPDMDFSIGQSQNRIAQLKGSWKLQTVIQTDVNARDNNYVDPTRPGLDVVKKDITNAFPYTDIVITFAEDASSLPTTFTINYGAAPPVFKHTTGTWTADNLKTPGIIKLINGTDTFSVKLGAVNNLSSDMVTLQKIKSQGTKPKIQYDYNFKKI